MKFLPDANWTAPAVSSLPSWSGAKRISIDIETRDPELRKKGPGVRRGDAYVVGISFAIQDGPAHYLPIAHQTPDGGNLDPALVWKYLQDNANSFRGEVVGANLQYDMDFLFHAGVNFFGARWRDVQVADPLLWEMYMSYSLDAIAERRGFPGKDETILKAFADHYGVDPKKDLWRLPPRAVGAYAERDARLPLEIYAQQEAEIDKEGLRGILDLECRLQPVLLKMRNRGVRVDLDRLSEIEKWARTRELQALSEISRQYGVGPLSDKDTNRTSVLAKILRSVGVPLKKLASGKDSVTAELLEKIEHPVGALIRRAKKFNKLRTTFAASIYTHSVNGRIHCTFNQLPTSHGEDDNDGARYGRMSCKNPNLQQQPSRDKEIAPVWRRIYLPEDGMLWASCDFSQQEPRWLTHYAELQKLEGAEKAADRYRTDPTTDNHQMTADMCGIARTPAKEIFLGLCYGMGGAKLCRKLGLPTEWMVKWKGQWFPEDSPEGRDARLNGCRLVEVAGKEGKALLDKFDAGAPYVRALSREAEKAAKARGWIRTAGGRKCHFVKGPQGYEYTYKALNRLVQGSSGDQTKKAMVDCDDAGFELQLQVHDELDQSVTSREHAEQLASVMRGAIPCNVPHVVDVEVGPSWGEVC